MIKKYTFYNYINFINELFFINYKFILLKIRIDIFKKTIFQKNQIISSFFQNKKSIIIIIIIMAIVIKIN